MRLEKLSETALWTEAGKKICCCERSAKHLTELCDKYGIEDRITLILDDRIRYQGLFLFRERQIPVRGLNELEQDELRDCVVIITSDYHQEVYDRLCREEVFWKNWDTVYYFEDRETEIDLHYREKYQNTPLEDMIIYRSGPHAASYVKGMDYADNARALFEYMIEKGYNHRYELVWLVKNPSEFSSIEQRYSNVRFLSFEWPTSDVKEERETYYRALCLAKYIFMTDAYGFCRNARADQIRVQLWHGCGFKTRINFDRCEHRYEYNIVISEVYKKFHQKIYGLREDQVLVTGYPKDDLLFHPFKGWKDRLQLPTAKIYILWLPTFRTPVGQLSELNEQVPEGQTGLPIIQSRRELQELNQFLSERDICLIVKLHPFQDVQSIGMEDLSNIVLLTNEQLAKEDIQVNQILGNADGLISDYSSAAIDFLLLDRPVAFTLDDVEEYEKSRGFVFKPIKNWLPGEEIYSYSDFIEFIEAVADGKDCVREKRRALAQKLHQFHDDQSSRRVLEALGIKMDLPKKGKEML